MQDNLQIYFYTSCSELWIESPTLCLICSENLFMKTIVQALHFFQDLSGSGAKLKANTDGSQACKASGQIYHQWCLIGLEGASSGSLTMLNNLHL